MGGGGKWEGGNRIDPKKSLAKNLSVLMTNIFSTVHLYLSSEQVGNHNGVWKTLGIQFLQKTDFFGKFLGI